MLGRDASVAGLLVFGTTTSLFAKIVYELKSDGLKQKDKLFEKPWAMTTVMFLGMSLCLPLAFYYDNKRSKARQTRDAEEPLLSHSEEEEHKGQPEWRQALLLSIPTIFDLIATVLMNIGLLYVTASVYQMMRGAEMLFAALFAVLFLQRTLNKWHYMGITCCVVGIGLVGLSSTLHGESGVGRKSTKSEILMGMGLIVISQAVQAAQITFEDFFMSDMNIPPMKIVGYEGVIGASMMIFVMLPAVNFLPGEEGNGLHENSLDTLHMIRGSWVLQIVLAVDMLALLMYNLAGMAVTGHLGAVFRTVLETLRTLFVWLVDLLLFYTPLGYGQLGESWSVYSYMQAAGFVILVIGTFVYGKGDEEPQEDTAKAVTEALAAAAAVPPRDGPAHQHPPVLTGSVAVPVTPRNAMPINVPSSSYKSTMTLTAGSYSRSMPRSLRYVNATPPPVVGVLD